MKEATARRETHGLKAPLLAAGLLRLGLLAAVVARSGTVALSRPDTASYLTPGRNLLLHGFFGAGGLAEIDRTPGYGLFLALVSLAGPVAVALAQIGLSVLTVWLVARLARTVVGDERGALTAAWLFAVEPLSIVYSILMLSETLFLALLVVSLERLALFLRTRRLPLLVVAGVGLAAATFVRPVTFYLPWALAAGLFLTLARVPEKKLLPAKSRFVLSPVPKSEGPGAPGIMVSCTEDRKYRWDTGMRWKAPAVLLLSTLPWLGAWQMRNWVESGYSGFSSIATRNLYFFNAAEVTGRVEGLPLAEVQSRLGYNDEQLFVQQHPETAEWNQAQRLRWMGAEAGRVIRAHPALFARLYLAGVLRTALNPGAAVFVSLFDAHADEETYQRERERGALRTALWAARTHPGQTALRLVLEAWLLGLYLLAAWGAMRGDAWRAGLGLLIGVALYFLVVSGGAVGAARLRLPVMPAICILAATCGGASHLRWGQRPSARPAPEKRRGRE